MDLKGKKVVVTGGAGFIGSHVVDDFVASGAQVTVFDNFSSGREEHLAHLTGKIRVVRGDILDAEALDAVCDGIDLISHHAAQLEITSCIDDPVGDLRTNGEGTLRVFEAARKHRVPKVIYASSACVYGQAQQLPESEDHPKQPNWPYGVSKYATELYADIYHKFYGISMIGLRYAIIYGPREWYGRVITAFLKRAFEKQPPVIWGGQQVRDFTYVADVVRLHHLCATNENLTNDVFNVSTGKGTTIRELAETTRRLFGIDAPIIEEQLAENDVSAHLVGRRRLPAELQQMVLDNTHAKTVLNWSAQTPLDTGLKAEFAWLQKNAQLWKSMSY